MRYQLATLIALTSCLGACGSLLGIGDLPALDGSAGSDSGNAVAPDSEAIVAESGSATEGGPIDATPATGGESGSAAAEAGQTSDSAVPGSETGPAEAAVPSDAQSDAATADAQAPDAATGVCTPTATQCTSETQVETCGSDGQWEGPTTCQYACVDDAGGACGGICTPGAMQCSGGAAETCSSEGQWVTTTTCSGGMTCAVSGGTAACACPSGETSCGGTCFDLATGTPGAGGLGPNHCGTCTGSCAIGASCVDGTCQ
jgi:hypothetical protein